MKSLRARVLLAALAALLACGPVAVAQPAQPAPPKAKTGGAPGVTAIEAILVNFTDDNQVLFTRQATVPRAPASLTKIVTALVARDEYALDDVVVTTPLVLQTGGSDLALEPGMRITVRELLYALLLKSANDAAMALAAHDPAGYEHFIQLMNQKARSLGASGSDFRNPHGLDQIGHVSSARDMAIFTREMLRDRLLTHIAGTRRHTMTWKGRARWYDHHHKLLLSNDSVVMGKTAFTNQAGHGLVTVADTPAGRLIAVVMGSNDQYGDTRSMIEYGKAVAARQASGGGSARGFGQLLRPPAPPDKALAVPALPSSSDPRDDVRWSILMLVLAGVSAYMLLASRRRPAKVAASGVNEWLASLRADRPAQRARRRR
jgi:serine-type D-Ala-D-Ala carboxypeptidase (penicillin-binding protein 5/6)